MTAAHAARPDAAFDFTWVDDRWIALRAVATSW
jgi:hypothetical protein